MAECHILGALLVKKPLYDGDSFATMAKVPMLTFAPISSLRTRLVAGILG
jgi:hypothetical protein